MVAELLISLEPDNLNAATRLQQYHYGSSETSYLRTPAAVSGTDTQPGMNEIPPQLQTFDLVKTDDVVREYLITECLDHPTRGPYIKSRVLYEGVEDEIDDRFSLELFGLFCESRSYLEKWSRGYGGSYRYRILREYFR